jgi:hypothetical protein
MTHGTDRSIEVLHPPSTVPCRDGQLSELAKKLRQPPTSACRRRRAAFGKVASRDARTVAAVARATRARRSAARTPSVSINVYLVFPSQTRFLGDKQKETE